MKRWLLVLAKAGMAALVLLVPLGAQAQTHARYTNSDGSASPSVSVLCSDGTTQNAIACPGDDPTHAQYTNGDGSASPAQVLLCPQGGTTVACSFGPAGSINLSSYGVKCDGVTDVYAAYEAAYAAALLIGKANLVWPSGTCNFGTPIANAMNNIAWTGQAVGPTILHYTGVANAGGYEVQFASATPDTLQLTNVTVRNITLQSPNTSDENDTGWQFLNVGHLRVENVNEQYAFVGYEVAGGQYSSLSHFEYDCNTAFTSPPAGSSGVWWHGETGTQYDQVSSASADHGWITCDSNPGKEEVGLRINSADGLTVSETYTGGFATARLLEPDSTSGSSLIDVELLGDRCDYGGGTGPSGQFICTDIEVNPSNATATMSPVYIIGDKVSNSHQTTGYGDIINAPLAQVIILGSEFASATSNAVYCEQSANLSLGFNSFRNTPIGGTTVNCPNGNTLSNFVYVGNNNKSTDTGTVGLNIGTVGAGNASATIWGNNFGATSKSVDATVTTLDDCGNTTTGTAMNCTFSGKLNTFTLNGNLNFNGFNAAGLGSTSSNNAHGFQWLGGANPGTCPIGMPDKSDQKAGFGTNAAGNASLFADNAGVCLEMFRATNTGTTTFGHVVSSGTALSCSSVVFGAGAGTSPSCTSVTGDDRRFSFSFSSGTTPSASSVLATITFNIAYAAAPQCTFTNANGNAALTFSNRLYLTSTTTTVVINVDSSSITGSAAYVMNVNCTG